MAIPQSLRSYTRWLLFLPVAAGLVLFAAHTLAERRAQQEAMSAELLSLPEERAPQSVTDGPAPLASPAPATTEREPIVTEPDPVVTAPDPVSTRPGRVADSPSAPPLTVRTSAGDVQSIVPPELMGALVQDSVEAPRSAPSLDPTLFADWSTYDDAVKHSRETGRPVMLAFTAVGCETCESLRESVFDEEAASVTMRSAVIPVAVHDVFSATGSEARLVDQLQHDFGVTTFPTLVVWSPTSKRLRTLKGYRGAAATLRFIVDAASAVN